MVPTTITSDLASWQRDYPARNSALTLFEAPSCHDAISVSRPSISSCITTEGVLRVATVNKALTILLWVSPCESIEQTTESYSLLAISNVPRHDTGRRGVERPNSGIRCRYAGNEWFARPRGTTQE